MSKLNIQDSTPNHLKELEALLRTANVGAKKNPGQIKIFDGNFWVPLEKLLKDVDNLVALVNAQNEALRLVNAYTTENSLLAAKVRKAREFYETGKEPKE